MPPVHEGFEHKTITDTAERRAFGFPLSLLPLHSIEKFISISPGVACRTLRIIYSRLIPKSIDGPGRAICTMPMVSHYDFKKALSLTAIVCPFISVGAQVFSVVRKCINSGIFRKIETFRAMTCMCVVNNEYKNLQPILRTLKQILLQRNHW